MSFKIYKQYLTENDCYRQYKKHKVKGIMVHSTGANNPYLSRYIQPDDGIIGKNKYGNHWNQPGISKAVHAFIGKDKNGKVRTYQTLPWEIAGWHSGVGTKGYWQNANNTGYIGFEVCEDGLTDKTYFNEVYEEAVNLCVYLCKKFNLTEKNIIDHSEGHKLGIASNHSDISHWFRKHGKTMDDFRRDVKNKLNEKEGDLTMSQYKELKNEIEALKKLIDKKLTKPSNYDSKTPTWGREVWKEVSEVENYFDGTRPHNFLSRIESGVLIKRLINNIRKYEVEPLQEKIKELENKIKKLESNK